MQRFIYALHYAEPTEEGPQRRYFYVGRSVDVASRERQHRALIKRGTEDKYAFMRRLAERGTEWSAETVRIIPDGSYPPDNERWWVIKLTRDGHQLTNMRHGSPERRRELAEQVKDLSIRSVEDVASDRVVRTARSQGASRRLRRRLLEAELRNVGIADVKSCGLLPPLLKRRLEREGFGSVAKGIKLRELVHWVRVGCRALRELEASLDAAGVLPLPRPATSPSASV